MSSSTAPATSNAPRRQADSKIFTFSFHQHCSFRLDRTDVNNAKIVTVVATRGRGAEISEEISYADTKVIGNGSFGVVYQARLVHSNEQVAIKKVLQDKRFKVNNNSLISFFHSILLFSNLESRTSNYATIGSSKYRSIEIFLLFIW